MMVCTADHGDAALDDEDLADVDLADVDRAAVDVERHVEPQCAQQYVL